MADKQRRSSVTEGSNPAEGGKKRVPIHEQRNLLTVEGKDPNYVYRWVNDVKEGTRIQKFLRAGYEFVNKSEVAVGEPIAGRESESDSRSSKVVGVDSDKKEVVRAYLMRIKREWYEEDQATKQKINDEAEDGIRNRGGLPDGTDLNGFYGGIKLTRS